MLSILNPMLTEPEAASPVPRFLVEPEPWLRIFLRNVGDLFRKGPPPVWLTSAPGTYWPNALVHRPAAWTAIRQSGLLHVLALLAVYELTLNWVTLTPAEVIYVGPRNTIIHYQVSQYLPPVMPLQKPTPPVRPKARVPDPEYAAQEIISMHVDHTSKRQTIIQADPAQLPHDVPLPNMMVSSQIPGAPVVAAARPSMNLPTNAPQVVPPSQLAAEHVPNRLVFPEVARPEVAPPASPLAANRSTPVLPVAGPVVVAPSQETATRDPRRLQIAAQAPEVAPPASTVAARRTLGQAVPQTAPDVVPPAQQVAARRGTAPALPDQQPTVAPPPQPVSTAPSDSHAKSIGQLLALNAQPVAPVGPLAVPEGNRKGEFAASPTGRTGATAQPETVAGKPEDVSHGGAASAPANVFVSAPPNKFSTDAVVASAPRSPFARTATPDHTDLPADKIDNQIFGSRNRFSMKLGMANLNSATGSWTMRFAELHGDPAAEGKLSYPDPVKKVDPAYPANMVHDRIEGVVVLYAVIRVDGTVGEVKVLEGFNDRLDENARLALQQWRFRPGTRNGVPVDIEAVVRVPFRVVKPEW